MSDKADEMALYAMNPQARSSPQKRTLCFEMAKLALFNATDSSFDFVFDTLDIEKPATFSHDNEIDNTIYQELEELYVNKLTLEYLLLATHNEEEFTEVDSELLEKFLQLPDDLDQPTIDQFLDNASDAWF